MEENRLTPMVEGYDPIIFNTLYKKTEGLRKKLTSEIDHHRFGLQFEDVLSWFDVKFIHVFNKYYHMGEDILLGHLINSLKLFKCRILRGAYTQKFSQTIINVEDSGLLEDHEVYDPESSASFYYDKLIMALKDYLSDNAIYLLEIQLNPPPYIIHRMNKATDKKLSTITDELILEYFDLPINQKTLKFLSGLKAEIKDGLDYARKRFSKAS